MSDSVDIPRDVLVEAILIAEREEGDGEALTILLDGVQVAVLSLPDCRRLLRECAPGRPAAGVRADKLRSSEPDWLRRGR